MLISAISGKMFILAIAHLFKFEIILTVETKLQFYTFDTTVPYVWTVSSRWSKVQNYNVLTKLQCTFDTVVALRVCQREEEALQKRRSNTIVTLSNIILSM